MAETGRTLALSPTPLIYWGVGGVKLPNYAKNKPAAPYLQGLRVVRGDDFGFHLPEKIEDSPKQITA